MVDLDKTTDRIVQEGLRCVFRFSFLDSRYLLLIAPSFALMDVQIGYAGNPQLFITLPHHPWLRDRRRGSVLTELRWMTLKKLENWRLRQSGPQMTEP